MRNGWEKVFFFLFLGSNSYSSFFCFPLRNEYKNFYFKSLYLNYLNIFIQFLESAPDVELSHRLLIIELDIYISIYYIKKNKTDKTETTLLFFFLSIPYSRFPLFRFPSFFVFHIELLLTYIQSIDGVPIKSLKILSSLLN